MALEGPRISPARNWTYLPPVVWAAFAWLFVVCFTQVSGTTFYALVRGVGAVEYSDAIVVGSRALDLGLLAAVTVAMAWVPLQVGGWRWWSDPVRIGSLAVMLVGLAAAVWSSSPFAFLPLGLGALLLFSVDARGLSDERGVHVGRSVALTALFGLSVVAVVAVLGDIRWIIGGFDGSRPFSDPSWGFSLVSLQLIAILDPILPEITLIMLFGWVGALAIPRVSRSAKRWMQEGSMNWSAGPLQGLSSRRVSLAMLGVAVAISAFVGAYPYLHAVNPNSLIVGVDPRYCYSQIMQGLPGQGYPCGGATTSYYYAHYGVFLLLQGLSAIGGSDLFAFELAFPILAVFLTMSTFVFAKEGTMNALAAGVGALFASTSLQVVAGVNAGLLGNWFALSFALLFFGAVLRALRTRKLGHFALAYVLAATTLFTHVWTGALAIGVLGIFLVLTLSGAARKKELGTKKIEGLILGSLILAVLATDAVRALLPFGSGLETSVDWVLPALSFSNVGYVIQDLQATFVMYVLGGFANTTWYVLGAVGVLALLTLKRDLANLLGSWVAATSAAYLVFASTDPNALPTRFLYMLPLQVFGTVGFISVLEFLVMRFGDASGGRTAKRLLAASLVAVMGLALGFALDNMGYVYRGIPGT